MSTPTESQSKIVLVAIIIFCSVYFLTTTILFPFANPDLAFGKNDFAVYYAAAKNLHNDKIDIYSNDLAKYVKQIRKEKSGTRYLYPPVFLNVIRPFTAFSFYTASRLWIIVNVLLTGATIVLLVKIFRREASLLAWTAVTALCTLFPAFIRTIESGQMDILMLVGVLASIFFFTRNKQIPAGIALACAVMVKIFPIVLLPYFLFKKQYKLALATLLTLLVLFLSTVAAGNLRYERTYYTTVLPDLVGSGIYEADTLDNRTLTGFFARNFQASKLTTPVFTLSDTTAHVLIRIITLIALGFGAWVIIANRKKQTAILDISYLLIFVLLFSQTTHYFFFIFLMLPFAYFLLQQPYARKFLPWYVVLAIAYTILAFPAKIPMDAAFLRATPGAGILASPQVIGLFLLFIVVAYTHYTLSRSPKA